MTTPGPLERQVAPLVALMRELAADLRKNPERVKLAADVQPLVARIAQAGAVLVVLQFEPVPLLDTDAEHLCSYTHLLRSRGLARHPLAFAG